MNYKRGLLSRGMGLLLRGEGGGLYFLDCTVLHFESKHSVSTVVALFCCTVVTRLSEIDFF